MSKKKPKESLDVTSEPTNLVSCVSNAAMDTVHELAEQNGAKVLRVFIVLHLAEGPGGEIAEVCSASGTEISRDLSVGQRQLFVLPRRIRGAGYRAHKPTGRKDA